MGSPALMGSVVAAELRRRRQVALAENDLHMYRMLHAVASMLLKGTGVHPLGEGLGEGADVAPLAAQGPGGIESESSEGAAEGDGGAADGAAEGAAEGGGDGAAESAAEGGGDDDERESAWDRSKVVRFEAGSEEERADFEEEESPSDNWLVKMLLSRVTEREESTGFTALHYAVLEVSRGLAPPGHMSGLPLLSLDLQSCDPLQPLSTPYAPSRFPCVLLHASLCAGPHGPTHAPTAVYYRVIVKVQFYQLSSDRDNRLSETGPDRSL